MGRSGWETKWKTRVFLSDVNHFSSKKRALSSCKDANWAPNERHLGRVSGLWDGNCKESDAMKIFAQSNASFVELLVFLYKTKPCLSSYEANNCTLFFTLLSNNKRYRNFQEDKARFPSDTKTRWRTAFLMQRKFKTAYLPILSRSGQTDLFVTGPVVTGQGITELIPKGEKEHKWIH